MGTLPFFDVHTHIFHPKIADKVVGQLQEYYKISLIGTGVWEDFSPRLIASGIQYFCAHSAATNAEQVIPANRWAISMKKNYPGAVPFGTMHPDFEKLEDELAVLWDAGIRGIKLHPEFQGFWLDDPRLDTLFAAMEGNFVLMSHVGDVRPPSETESCPYKIAAIKRKFPKLQIIAAHFGGIFHWKYVVDALKGSGVYMDTSSSLWKIPDDVLQKIWRNFPMDNFLFGSDYPLFDPASEMHVLQQRLKLSDADLEKIMTNANALNLLV